MSKSLIMRASTAAAFALSFASPASAAIIFDPHPFSGLGPLGQQVHSSGTQSASTVFGFLSPGTPLSVTATSLSVLDTNGNGHAKFENGSGFDDLSIFFTNGEFFSAVEFNISPFGRGQASANATLSYFLNGSNVAAGSFNFVANNGENKFRLYGDAGEKLSKITFDATSGSFDSIRQVDFAVIPGAIPEPATWAMLLAGFGTMGFAIRARRRRQTVTTALA